MCPLPWSLYRTEYRQRVDSIGPLRLPHPRQPRDPSVQLGRSNWFRHGKGKLLLNALEDELMLHPARGGGSVH